MSKPTDDATDLFLLILVIVLIGLPLYFLQDTIGLEKLFATFLQ